MTTVATLDQSKGCRVFPVDDGTETRDKFSFMPDGTNSVDRLSACG